ncbi:MAG: hypothetical protein Q9182_006388 [Xanthomendoza sp. 2 TL-2023]
MDRIISLLVVAFVLRRVWLVLYNLFGHPLRKVPGPKLYAVSAIPQTLRSNVLGHHYSDLVSLHEKYGDVVRVSPDEISCVSPESWKIIHGTGEYFLKDPRLTAMFPGGTDNLDSSDRERHRLFRNLIGPVFSDRALAAQSPKIVNFADKMISALKQRSDKPVDIALALEWATVDVMGILMLGKSFDCLEKWKSPRFLQLMHASGEAVAFMELILRFKPLAFFYSHITRLPFVQNWLEGLNHAKGSVRARIEAGTSTKTDAISMIWEEKNNINSTNINISQSSIEGLSSLLFFAGFETTATALGGIIWLLLRNPQAYERLTAEIRSISEADLIPRTLGSLTYLNCAIQEGLRLHSPITLALARIVPKGGTTIDGYFVPEGVSTFISVFIPSTCL